MRKILYISFFTILGLFSAVTIGSLQAETAEQIQAKIDISNQNRAELEKEIANYEKQLGTISNQANTLQNTIKTLDVSTNKITTEVKLTTNNINQTSLTIQDTGLKINDHERQISKGNMVIRDMIRQTAEADSDSILELLLSNNDLSDFWNDLESSIQFQAKMSDKVTEVETIKSQLEKAKNNLELKKNELEKYTQELNGKKQALQSTKKEKSTLLAVTKNTEATFQKILKDKLALKEALDREVASYESQLKLIVDPKSFPPAGKGILAWPLDVIRITQNFGVTSASGRLYASGSHNGTDFGVPTGSRVKSAANGIVEGTGDTDVICPGASYGKWVFIRYDNGLASTYGHLSAITAVLGQRVKAGDVVAYSGNSGYSTGPHLHMSVYAGQGVKVSTLKSTVCKGTYTIPLAGASSYLDPLIYL